MNIKMDGGDQFPDTELDEGYELIPPHRRDIVRERIRLIRRFVAGDVTGTAAAATLGMTASNFSHLVRAWRQDPSPSALAGAGRTARTFTRLSQDQRDIIDEVTREEPHALVERLVERAMELGHDRGVAMPSWGAMTRRVGEAVTGTLPHDMAAAAADLIVEHAVVDLPLRHVDGSMVYMPIVTFVMRRLHPAVVGLAIAGEGPTCTAVSTALAEAIRRSPAVEDRPVASLYMDTLPGEDWTRLRDGIGDAGLRVIGTAIPAVRPPLALVRLFGRARGGVRIWPRLGRRPVIARRPTDRVGRTSYSFQDASEFLRSKWLDPTGGQVRTGSGQMPTRLAAFLDGGSEDGS